MIETLREHLKRLPAEHLRDLARNGAAPLATRKLAYQLLVEAKHPYAKTHEMFLLAMGEPGEDLAEALDEVAEHLMETAPVSGAPSASVTTATLYETRVASADGAIRTEDLVTGVKTQNGVVVGIFKPVEVESHK